MQSSQVYLMAAEVVDNADLKSEWRCACCPALDSIYPRFQKGDFANYFKPSKTDWLDRWFGAYTEDNKQWRVLALLFMHQISLDEERGRK